MTLRKGVRVECAAGAVGDILLREAAQDREPQRMTERGDGLVFHAADLRRANIYELIEEAVV